MSSAQILNHKKDNNYEYAERSKNISDRCINLLKELDTKLVTKKVNEMLTEIDSMGNSFDNEIKYIIRIFLWLIFIKVKKPTIDTKINT